MTTNDNIEQPDEAAARCREEAAIQRDHDAEDRDDAAKVRDSAAQRRETSATFRHNEIRKDIHDTQGMVTGGTGEVIFHVEGLQDKFFEHLIFATNAIEDATQALEDERRTRKIQIFVLTVAMALGLVMSVFVTLNTLHIEEQRERSDEIACLAINENRDTIYEVLETLAARDGEIDAEERGLLKGFREGSLLPLDCTDGINFMEVDGDETPPTTTP